MKRPIILIFDIFIQFFWHLSEKRACLDESRVKEEHAK